MEMDSDPVKNNILGVGEGCILLKQSISIFKIVYVWNTHAVFLGWLNFSLDLIRNVHRSLVRYLSSYKLIGDVFCL